MINNQLIHEIRRLKEEKDAVILAHNYQLPQIQDIADFLGDSLDLSRKAASVPNSTIVFCGVRFMAETAKILSPEKKVLIPRQDAHCPMAEMAVRNDVEQLRKEHPGARIVTYVNSTADIKAVSDVCCTSANSIKVVNGIDSDTVIFIPDKNLGAYTQRFTDKKMILWDGYCYVHARFTADEIDEAKKKYPDAVILVHPECPPDVIDKSDKVFSTSGMVRFARESDKKLFIIGTEEGLIHRLQKENPGKKFISLGSSKTCRGMKTIGLDDVYRALMDDRYEVTLEPGIITNARSALEKML